MKILVCDDRDAEKVKKSIDETLTALGIADVEVDVMDATALVEAFGILKRRANAVLLSEPTDEGRPEEPLGFDDTDIVVLDNNLAELDIAGARLTAESVVGDVRAFTSAGYLVSVNKRPSVDFDLAYLVGDARTKADLGLAKRHLRDESLWRAPLDGEDARFAPWYWPDLLMEPARRARQIEFVEAALDRPLLPTLGFEADRQGRLSEEAIAYIEPDAKKPGGDDSAALVEVTFRDYFRRSERTLVQADRERIEAVSHDAGNRHAAGTARKIMARVIAAELDLWFRMEVLGPQEVLADLPHVMARFPFASEEIWKSKVDLTAPIVAEEAFIDRSFVDRFVQSARYEQSGLWVPRDAYWVGDIEGAEGMRQATVDLPSSYQFKFCEDTGRFADIRTVASRSFVPERGFEWQPLYVAEPESGRQYVPQAFFSL